MAARAFWREQEARRTARALAVLARGRRRLKAFRLFVEVERHHPHEPHWYLAIFATDPSAQGRGIASALLAPVLERCDRHGTIAYTLLQGARQSGTAVP